MVTGMPVDVPAQPSAAPSPFTHALALAAERLPPAFREQFLLWPGAYRHFILIALLGKILGPLGFAWSVGSGALPAAFRWTILTNDLIWWPAFGLYLRDAARAYGGLGALLRGE